MRARNYAAWREAVRAAYDLGTADPNHVGPWGNPGIWRLPFEEGDFMIISWPYFGPVGAVQLTIDEAYSEVEFTSQQFTDATPTATETRTTLGAVSLEVMVPASDVVPYNLATPFPLPEIPTVFRVHSSATPFGEGLYDAVGGVLVYTERSREESFTSTATPEINTDTSVVEPHLVNVTYRSDWTAISGLTTPCRARAAQTYHGPARAFDDDVAIIEDNPGGADDVFERTPIYFLPFATNPDGEDLEGTALEEYFTDTFLQKLQGGSWTSTMVRVTGSAGGSVPNYDDTSDNGVYSWTHNWTRSGTFTLLLG